MRKIISEIQAIIPDVRYDTDRVIDNKSIMQLSAINEKLKKKVSADKEVIFLACGVQRFSDIYMKYLSEKFSSIPVLIDQILIL